MNVVSIASQSPDHASIRDRFAQAAYAGDLPRTQWIAAQRLVSDYDAATDDATRIAISTAMLDLSVRSDDMPSLRAVA